MRPGQRISLILRIATLVGTVLAMVLVWLWVPKDVLRGWVVDRADGHGLVPTLGYVAVASLAVVVGAPLTVFILVAGAVFSLPTAAAATAGIVTCSTIPGYLVGRLLGTAPQAAEVAPGRLAAVRRLLRDQHLLVIVMLRMTPSLPYGATNIVFGSCHVAFWRFALGTAIGMVPGMTMLIYLGHVGGIGLTAEDPLAAMPASAFWVLGIAAVVVIAIAVTLGMRFRRCLGASGG